MFANVLENNKQNILRAIHELNKHTWSTLVNISARSKYGFSYYFLDKEDAQPQILYVSDMMQMYVVQCVQAWELSNVLNFYWKKILTIQCD